MSRYLIQKPDNTFLRQRRKRPVLRVKNKMSNAAAICVLLKEANTDRLTVRGYKSVKRATESLLQSGGISNLEEEKILIEATGYNREFWEVCIAGKKAAE